MSGTLDPDSWLDREERALDRQLEAEAITQEEYDAGVLAMRAEYRMMLRDRR